MQKGKPANAIQDVSRFPYFITRGDSSLRGLTRPRGCQRHSHRRNRCNDRYICRYPDSRCTFYRFFWP